MISRTLILLLIAACISCTEKDIYVKNANELENAIANAGPGDKIVLANGVWKDIKIEFKANGTAEKRIVLAAETPGEVFIEGQSYLKFGGNYLTVEGLYFRNGYTPDNVLVDFRLKGKVANYCRLTNAVIEGFNQPHRDAFDHWVEFWGRHNEMDHCYIAGKSNNGPTIRVQIKGNESIYNYHKIVNNLFGPRPRKGGPHAETIQIGDSQTSVSPSYTLVEHNYFDKCNGEIEVISSKSNFNEFRNNVFFQCEGSLVTRHGNYCTIDGNYFIGNGSKNIGGIRLINTGHWVTNNYFYNLKGSDFRSPLAVMNGIPKSPQNRYNQVTDVVVAYNSWIDCASPWQFGVGQNLEMKQVLPASEIRSARPKRVLVANNIIYSEQGEPSPIVAHDKIDGVTFESNIINKDYEPSVDGLKPFDFSVAESLDFVYVPGEKISQIKPYDGFEFSKITKDIFGTPRTSGNVIGAGLLTSTPDGSPFDHKNYGPDWFVKNEKNEPVMHKVSSVDELTITAEKAGAGDILVLKEGVYNVEQPIKIDKALTIKSETGNVKVIFQGNASKPLFELHPKGFLTITNIKLQGDSQNYAFAPLKDGMTSRYNLKVNDSKIEEFAVVVKAYKQSFADSITFKNTEITNCKNGLDLAAEIDDKGNYNVEFLTIDKSEFENVGANVINYYRGGYDESTIGGNLLVRNSVFTNCGKNEPSNILLKHRGIVNVDLVGNTFKNNPVEFVAILWGAKNNKESDNQLVNSGSVKTQENVKLTLMY